MTDILGRVCAETGQTAQEFRGGSGEAVQGRKEIGDQIDPLPIDQVSQGNYGLGVSSDGEFARKEQSVAVHPTFQEVDQIVHRASDRGVGGDPFPPRCDPEPNPSAPNSQDESERPASRVEEKCCSSERAQALHQPAVASCQHHNRRVNAGLHNPGRRRRQKEAQPKHIEGRTEESAPGRLDNGRRSCC